jgi:hypothetical protein
VDGLAVERERGRAARDEVQLLVAGALLGVRLDDVVAGVLRHVGVGAERADPELVPDRQPAQRARAGERLDVFEAGDLPAHASPSRNAHPE